MSRRKREREFFES